MTAPRGSDSSVHPSIHPVGSHAEGSQLGSRLSPAFCCGLGGVKGGGRGKEGGRGATGQRPGCNKRTIPGAKCRGKTSGSRQIRGWHVHPSVCWPVISAFPSRGKRRVRSQSGAVQLPKLSGAAHYGTPPRKELVAFMERAAARSAPTTRIINSGFTTNLSLGGGGGVKNCHFVSSTLPSCFVFPPRFSKAK